jgi:hypothetical protein
MVVSSMTIAPRYGVVLRCPHGSFAVEGDDFSAAAATWKKVVKGDRVTIYYSETVERNVKTGEEHVANLHFERAEPVR